MKEKKFSFKILEEGRISKEDLNLFKGGTSYCDFACPQENFAVSCYLYTHCSETLGNYKLCLSDGCFKSCIGKEDYEAKWGNATSVLSSSLTKLSATNITLKIK